MTYIIKFNGFNEEIYSFNNKHEFAEKLTELITNRRTALEYVRLQ